MREFHVEFVFAKKVLFSLKSTLSPSINAPSAQKRLTWILLSRLMLQASV